VHDILTHRRAKGKVPGNVERKTIDGAAINGPAGPAVVYRSEIS